MTTQLITPNHTPPYTIINEYSGAVITVGPKKEPGVILGLQLGRDLKARDAFVIRVGGADLLASRKDFTIPRPLAGKPKSHHKKKDAGHGKKDESGLMAELIKK